MVIIRFCAHCNSLAFGDFCTKCGKKAGPIPTCVFCKCEIWPHDDFCRGCGRPRSEALNESLRPPKPQKMSIWEAVRAYLSL